MKRSTSSLGRSFESGASAAPAGRPSGLARSPRQLRTRPEVWLLACLAFASAGFIFREGALQGGGEELGRGWTLNPGTRQTDRVLRSNGSAAGSAGRSSTAGRAYLRVAMLTSYQPPMFCGVGIWAADLVQKGFQALCEAGPSEAGGAPQGCPAEVGVFLLAPDGINLSRLPAEVVQVVRKEWLPDYVAAARQISREYDVLTVQHDFGLLGGPHVADFLFPFFNELLVPVHVNFHTVVRHWPDVEQRVHLQEVAQRADLVTHAMPQTCERLQRMAPSMAACRHMPSAVDPNPPRAHLRDLPGGEALVGREVLLSLGFLGPSKGFDVVIDAMPAIVSKHPNAVYVIVGAQHPHYRGTYLEALHQQVQRLHMERHVAFVSERNIDQVEAHQWISAADIVIIPYTDRQQSASGTVAVAMGLGKPVVATPFPFTAEFMCNDSLPIVDADYLAAAGLPPIHQSLTQEAFPSDDRPPSCWTFPFGDTAALAATVSLLLDREELRNRTGQLAWRRTRPITWLHLARYSLSLYWDMIGRRSSSSRASGSRPLGALAGLTGRRRTVQSERRVRSAAAVNAAGRGTEEQEGEEEEEEEFRPIPRADLIRAIRGPVPRLPLPHWLSHGAPPGWRSIVSWQGSLVRFQEGSRFYVANGAFTLKGDLGRGQIRFAPRQEGMLFGYGVALTAEVHFSVDGRQHVTSTDGTQGSDHSTHTLKRGGTEFRQKVPILADGVRLGTLRAIYTIHPGDPRLGVTYQIAWQLSETQEEVAVQEIVSRSLYAERQPPCHDSFHSFVEKQRKGRKGRKGQRRPPPDVLLEGSREAKVTGDALLSGHGSSCQGGMASEALLSLLANATSLRYVSHSNRTDGRGFLYVDHRYAVQEGGLPAQLVVQEERLFLAPNAFSSLLSQRVLPRFRGTGSKQDKG